MVCSFGPMRTLPAVYVSAVIDGGSHPFPFRTRKLSLLSPMVLGLRARESRSLQDSRPLGRKRPRGLFFYARFTPFRSRDHARSVPGTCRSRAPCRKTGGLFVYIDRSRCVPARTLRLALALATTTRQYESLVAHAPCCKQRGGFFLYILLV